MGNDNASFAGRSVDVSTTVLGGSLDGDGGFLDGAASAEGGDAKKSSQSAQATQNTGMTDNSWLAAIWSGDFFMGPLDRGSSPINYIAYAEEEGFVGFHGHPLNGTKFFTWGQSGPGRFMQVSQATKQRMRQ